TGTRSPHAGAIIMSASSPTAPPRRRLTGSAPSAKSKGSARPRMRIVHVISNLDPRSGGPTTALLGLAPAQRRAGLDVEVVSTFAPDYRRDVEQQLESADVKVHLVGPVHGRLGRHPQLEPTL